jgi:rod shape-determining protein MreB
MDEAIVNHMRKTYNLMIGLQTAEQIKIEIGSIAELDQELTREVRGRDLISGLPRKSVVTSEELREALRDPVSQIIDCVTRTLERAEPELAADLVENGLHLVGGGALLRGLDKVMAAATGLDVVVVDDALSCVARGTAVYLEHLSEWKDTMESDANGM